MFDDVQVFGVTDVHCHLSPREWPFITGRNTEIEAHWRRVSEGKPAVFNGRVLLGHQWRHIDERFEATFFETDYAAVLSWLAFGEQGDAWNIFAMAALRSSDGAYLLGEMSGGTAQAGKIYFPAGTPDRGDIIGETVDLSGSVLRELEEETGLTRNDVAEDEAWTVLVTDKKVALMREVRSVLSAEALQNRIEAFLASDPQAELARIHIVRSVADLDAARMPRATLAFLTNRLGGDQRTG
jgi:8-oxo-dGTP pyrophosphatase MutT (NUDIX family)